MEATHCERMVSLNSTVDCDIDDFSFMFSCQSSFQLSEKVITIVNYFGFEFGFAK